MVIIQAAVIRVLIESVEGVHLGYEWHRSTVDCARLDACALILRRCGPAMIIFEARLSLKTSLALYLCHDCRLCQRTHMNSKE